MSEFEFATRDEFRQLRDVLQRNALSAEALSETLQTEDWLTLRMMDLPRFERLLSDDTAQHALMRLFVLGSRVPESRIAEAARPMTLDRWRQAGLLSAADDEGRVSARVRLIPFEDRYYISDCPRVNVDRAPADFVMGPSATSLELGWCAVPRPVERALDLGTGCGYLALNVAEFCERVVASDRNARAAQMTRFNALLNGQESVRVCIGNLLEPVERERFGLVICNPPFVITPAAEIMLRDSGVRGDEFCRQLIRAMPQHLEEGGYFQMLGNFGHRQQEPWRERLAAWFQDLGCDALVFVLQLQRADEYAMQWITTTETQNEVEVPRLFDDWMAFYEANGIDQIAYLAVHLRRRSASRNWVFVDTDEVRIAGPCGSQIEDRFAALDFLNGLPEDRALLQHRLILDSHARILQEHIMTEGGPRLAANRLEMRGSLRFSANLDGNVTRMLVGCDGTQPLSAICEDLAKQLELETRRVEQVALPVVRHLIQRGFVQTVDSAARL